MNIDKKIAYILSVLKRLKQVQPECVEDLYEQMRDVTVQIQIAEAEGIRQGFHELLYADVVDLNKLDNTKVIEMVYPKQDVKK